MVASGVRTEPDVCRFPRREPPNCPYCYQTRVVALDVGVSIVWEGQRYTRSLLFSVDGLGTRDAAIGFAKAELISQLAEMLGVPEASLGDPDWAARLFWVVMPHTQLSLHQRYASAQEAMGGSIQTLPPSSETQHGGDDDVGQS